MNDYEPLPRSPEMMSRNDTAMLVVDVQGKLVSLIPGHQRIVWNIRRLLDGAAILDVPTAATEQYPRGLGGTVPELASYFQEMPDKLTFSCGGCPQIFQQWSAQNIFKILIVGIEAHVCVQQTALDLLADGFRIYLAVDAVGARFAVDYETALRRMENAGVTLTTTEAALFEWCETAGTDQFKKVSGLVRETAPADQ